MWNGGKRGVETGGSKTKFNYPDGLKVGTKRGAALEGTATDAGEAIG